MIERRKNNQGMNGDYLMTERMVAEMALVPVNTIRYWRQMGILPFIKVGKHPRIWHSVFLKVFQKPLPIGLGDTDTMPFAGDVRSRA